MDRIEYLVQKLGEMVVAGAPPPRLLVTVQMLERELLEAIAGAAPERKGNISVMMPFAAPRVEMVLPEAEPQAPVSEEPPVFYTLEGLPTEGEEEEEVTAPEAPTSIPVAPVAPVIPAVPTPPYKPPRPPELLHTAVQQRSNDANIPTLPPVAPAPAAPVPTPLVPDPAPAEELSLNDRLRSATPERGESLHAEAIRDLRKGIGVNDKFTFINELFRGDEAMYERSIKTINGFEILPEAEYWINRELKVKLGWNEAAPTVKHFYSIVSRRFSRR